MMSLCCPISRQSPHDEIALRLNLSSSATLLIAVFGEYYSILNTGFDQPNHSRCQLIARRVKFLQLSITPTEPGCSCLSIIGMFE
ncbi:hypothetical protein V8C34DRAFT_295764 [Trichoderma compactum]